MAKSKNGGTRAYIRGRVGSDVYSIGKTAKGKKQQVVRSLAESVANPQTTAQMQGRMIMSTIMQAVAAFRPIIDHSFDNVTGKQANISEFISRNYGLIKADVAAHPTSGNHYALNEYQEKGAKPGEWLVSSGRLELPSGVSFGANSGMVEITLTADTMTYGGLKAKFGFANGDFLTILGTGGEGEMRYARLHFKEGVSDETALTDETLAGCFEVETNDDPVFAVVAAQNKITISLVYINNSLGAIMSKKTADGWEHNEKKLNVAANLGHAADVVLPTYPTGANAFLNGGDIF